MLEAILLLAGPAREPARVVALAQRRQHPVDLGERLELRDPLGAGLELAGRLRAAKQEHGQHPELLAVEPERLLRQVAVFDRAASVPARESREPVQAQPLGGLPHGGLVVGGHRIAVGRLVAGQPERVERQRILVRRGPALLDQTPQHTLLGRGKLGEMHGAENNGDPDR